MDKPRSFYAFERLYWTGIREGELLALTPVDFDFEKQTVSITKSYQRMKGRDVITDPKTPKSNRVVQMPSFLCDEIRDCMPYSLTIGYFKSRNHTYSARWSAAARKLVLSVSRCMVYATRIFLC